MSRYAMFFLVPSKLGNTSYEVRQIALNAMKTGVIPDILEKRYPDSHWYDAYRIGGYWSGCFAREFLNEEKLKAFYDEVEQTYGWPVKGSVIGIDSTTHEKRQKTLKIFLKYFPDFQGDLPYFRNEITIEGSPDDALFIDDQHKYDILFHEYEGESLVADPIRGIGLFNLSGLKVCPENIIGSHWAVIVACHF